MNTSSKKIFKAIVVGFFILGYGWAYLLTPHTSFQGSKSVEIVKGEGSRAIAEKLKDNGFIRSKWMLILYLTITGRDSDLKPGNFVFSSSSAIPEIVKRLSSESAAEQVITVLEGWNIDDITEYFEKENILSANDFYTIAKGKNSESWQKLISFFPFLSEVPKTSGLEGYLFPDTYKIYKNASAKEIIIKMLENFKKKVVPELQLEIARRNKSLFEIIITASLIEKEVISEEDRALISGILWKRLELGIGLNVDATINYIKQVTCNMKHETCNIRPSAKISTDDTKLESPYNTYKYRGLPPGPISNPGLSAIKSAIYPKKSEYLYYLSKPGGETVFSQTLEEHNIAKTKYLK